MDRPRAERERRSRSQSCRVLQVPVSDGRRSAWLMAIGVVSAVVVCVAMPREQGAGGARSRGARLRRSTEVIVRDDAGQEVRGRFVSASSAGVVPWRCRAAAGCSAPRRWPRSGVAAIACATAPSSVACSACSAASSANSACTDCGSEIALGIGLGVPLWAGVGALVDAQRVGRTLIYLAPGAPAPTVRRLAAPGRRKPRLAS